MAQGLIRGCQLGTFYLRQRGRLRPHRVYHSETEITLMPPLR